MLNVMTIIQIQGTGVIIIKSSPILDVRVINVLNVLLIVNHVNCMILISFVNNVMIIIIIISNNVLDVLILFA